MLDGGQEESKTRIRLALTRGRLIRQPQGASQFDLQLERKRELISNLRRNMPVLLDSSECTALKSDARESRLNSRFLYIHKNQLMLSQ
jgi:hypothetical protein